MTESPSIILNGTLVSEIEAKVSPLNRGMMYGDGCFETLKSYRRKFLEWNLHFQRLSESLEYLGIENDFTNTGLKEEISRLLKANNLDQKEALIRIQCWREGGRGYKPVSSKMSWMIQAEEIKNSYEPLKLITAETRCIPSQALERGFKLSNGLNYIKAAQEAQNRNADDALMLTMTDFISETTSANIFWLHDEAVFTPSEKCDLLPGITRKLVADVLLRNDVKLEKGEFSIAHIRQAEAAFCCNSVREIQEVASIDEKDMEIGHPLVKKIMVLFEKYKFELLNR